MKDDPICNDNDRVFIPIQVNADQCFVITSDEDLCTISVNKSTLVHSLKHVPKTGLIIGCDKRCGILFNHYVDYFQMFQELFTMMVRYLCIVNTISFNVIYGGIGC